MEYVHDFKGKGIHGRFKAFQINSCFLTSALQQQAMDSTIVKRSFLNFKMAQIFVSVKYNFVVRPEFIMRDLPLIVVYKKIYTSDCENGKNWS